MLRSWKNAAGRREKTFLKSSLRWLLAGRHAGGFSSQSRLLQCAISGGRRRNLLRLITDDSSLSPPWWASLSAGELHRVSRAHHHRAGRGRSPAAARLIGYPGGLPARLPAKQQRGGADITTRETGTKRAFFLIDKMGKCCRS